MDAEELELTILDIEERMDKAVSVANDNLSKIRTGRASTALLEDIKIDYYDTPTPMKQLASLSVPDPHTITISPFDPGSLPLIEKAIGQSDLGLVPNVSGDGLIRVNIPELSEERRKELVRVARNEAENGRVAIRNLRREANEAIKKADKASAISSDDAHRHMDDIQDKTDAHIKRVDSLLEQKESDLMTV